jgi:hypothetical protein
MKRNQQMMSIFLILLIGLTLQFKTKQVKDSKKVLASKNSLTDAMTEQRQYKPTNIQIKDSIVDKNEEKYPKRTEAESNQGMSSLYNNATQWNDTGLGEINYLDRHTIDCKQDNSAINSFKLEVGTFKEKVKGVFWEEMQDKKKIRYSYTCVKSPAISNNCREYSTTPNQVAFDTTLSLGFLIRHYLECPGGQVMKKFGFRGKGDFYYGLFAIFRKLEDYPKIWYEYTCCNAEISKTKYFETEKTPNEDNRYFNLKDQAVNGRDFNAISAFNLQCPEKRIFYSTRINILKGETSPYFPNPCDGPLKDARKAEDRSNAKNEALYNSKIFLGKYVYNN